MSVSLYCICVWCVVIPKSAEAKFRVPHSNTFYHIPLKQGFTLNLEVVVANSDSLASPPDIPPSWTVNTSTGMPALHIHLGTQTLVLIPGRKAPLSTKATSKPWRHLILLWNLQCFIELALTPLWISIIVTGKMCHVAKEECRQHLHLWNSISSLYYLLIEYIAPYTKSAV